MSWPKNNYIRPLDKTERDVCSYLWGGWLTDIEFVRRSKLFHNKFKELYKIDYSYYIQALDINPKNNLTDLEKEVALQIWKELPELNVVRGLRKFELIFYKETGIHYWKYLQIINVI